MTRFSWTGAPTKQPGIMHTSLLRVLTPASLSPLQQQAVVAHCAQLTDSWRGRKIVCRRLWYAQEDWSPELAAALHCPLRTDELQQDGLSAYIFLLLLPQSSDLHVAATPVSP